VTDKPILERDVVAYLIKQVKALGGEVRKVAWIGRRNAPDLYVMLPPGLLIPNFWAEAKRPGYRMDPHVDAQIREHERMQALCETVRVLDSFEAVDAALGRTA
jgi:hypothetical protein